MNLSLTALSDVCLSGSFCCYNALCRRIISSVCDAVHCPNTLYSEIYRADLFPIDRCPLRTLLIKCVRKVPCPGRINWRKTLYKFNWISLNHLKVLLFWISSHNFALE